MPGGWTQSSKVMRTINTYKFFTKQIKKGSAVTSLALLGCFLYACSYSDQVHHVYPGDDIQAVLDRAASHPYHKRVVVHSGTYRPSKHRQALIALNKQHDGIILEAVGDVTLTAANSQIAQEEDEGYPAVVNHVVYFGDGISSKTILRGFKITGANNHIIFSEDPEFMIQPEVAGLEKHKLFFYADGGGIKIFGRSFPTIEDCIIHDNYASPCAGGVSIEHKGTIGKNAVRFSNCIFRNNSCPINGAGIDMLRGSAAVVENCLFVDNKSNSNHDTRSSKVPPWRPKRGGGTLTIFPTSRVVVKNCTFTGNRNGVDDSGVNSIFEDCIFWMNNAPGGWLTAPRYELDIKDADGVRRCFLQGETIDLFGTLNPEENVLGCPDPKFDAAYRPQATGFEKAGYRPVVRDTSKSR